MLKIPSRSRLGRAVRATVGVLKATVAPSHRKPTDAALDDTVVPESMPDEHAKASPITADVPNAPGRSRQGAGVSEDALGLVNARLDLISERLDLLREQVALGRSVQEPPRIEHRAPAAGSLRQAVERLTDRLDRIERQNVRSAEDLASRVALRPPRMPSGLDILEGPPPPSASVGTDWDFVEAKGMGPRLNGIIQDLRLATLLELLQLERRVGVLVLRTAEHTLELNLRRGTVVGVRLDGSETDVVAAVREAFRWPAAEFGFRRTEAVGESGSPRSIHGLLLEVLRQNDEAARTG